MEHPFLNPSISHSGASFAPKTIRAMLDAYSTYAITEEHDMKESVLYDCERYYDACDG
ncbi:hypothetical protein ACT7DL_11305 [Bacillus paranthracis]